MVESVPDHINFPKAEEEVLAFWKDIGAFERSLELAKGRPRYSFYDGPPFATGLPHYGHILAGTIKDIVTRWAAMDGYYVERRFGWDCHGLPVEYEIDKKLGIKSPDQVTKMGIKAYNSECQKIVMTYANEWEQIVGRMGRWIDFKNDYKTMYPWFMESVWWVFKQLYEQGMIYKGFKVMPYSTGCRTPLSNFESGLNYKDVQDPAVVVSFPVTNNTDEEGTSFLAWTTTPWTLPSNLALCVNPDEEYVKVLDHKREQKFILMEQRLVQLYQSDAEYDVIKRYKGADLAGFTYKPLFNYFVHRAETGAFKVLVDKYVTDASGTGLVHQAPYFGEDDYRVCMANKVIEKDGEIICPVDECGCFTAEVTDFAKMYVKDADKFIMKKLKAEGRLIVQSTCKHSYPFCWRSDTPLIYKAVPSWFVTVEDIVEQLLENNSQTYWVPDFVKDKRFANWLKGARDWAISRNRYWGTPLPLWVSDDGEEVVCVGSIKELEELTGETFTNIHREYVDVKTIPSRMGKGELHRVPEVFDCWFESGSMPYAQQHYPFERKKEFEDSFPADFIAEGIDQTRGWFYTLLVLSTALFGKPPFKNLICNGLILASDGSKMSKRKQNYPQPTRIFDQYGADAVRLYLINSPAVRGDALKFKENGVKDVLKDVFLPWFNAYRYLVQNIQRLEREDGVVFRYSEDTWQLTEEHNYMDRWILSFTQSLIKFVRVEMKAYRLYTVVPRLLKFVDHLTNWYVRMNRRRLKGDYGTADCKAAIETLFIVIYSMVRVMAPFTPFLSETMYQNLKKVVAGVTLESVHFLMLPKVKEELIDTEIERAVCRLQSVIELARVSRDKRTLPVKYPLKEVVVVNDDEQFLKDVDSLRSYILEELNVKTLTTTTDRAAYQVKMEAAGDSKALGIRLKQASKEICKKIAGMSNAEIANIQKEGYAEICGERVDISEVRIKLVVENSGSNYEANSDWQALILLDCTVDQEAESEGLAREVTNRIQKLRKEAGLQPNDEITIHYEAGKELCKVIEDNQEMIQLAVKQPLTTSAPTNPSQVIICKEGEVKGYKLKLTIAARGSTDATVFAALQSSKDAGFLYCNVTDGSQTGTVILESVVGSGKLITYGRLCQMITELFKVSQPLTVYKEKEELTAQHNLAELNRATLTLRPSFTPSSPSGPACKHVFAAAGKTKVVLLTENPCGKNQLDKGQILHCAQMLLDSDQVKLYTDCKMNVPL
ncbi:isoleucine--tRNA ligase, cytoplasmic-like [Watersipora subatra]|uniref:isoleucine--tRNA ligase, cytoplasmic-like n=1 Tax=Watersipora subatra TaxID=2589382 RepID=UPI00355B289B